MKKKLIQILATDSKRCGQRTGCALPRHCAMGHRRLAEWLGRQQRLMSRSGLAAAIFLDYHEDGGSKLLQNVGK